VELRALLAVLCLANLFGVGVDSTGDAEEAALRFDLVDVAVDADSERRLRRLWVTGRLAFEDIFSVEVLADLTGEWA
jgi:hypothetical protein